MSTEKQQLIVPETADMAVSMPRLMEIAIQADKVDALERLVALDERMSARRAAQAFSDAMARFKATCPPVPRRTENTQFKVTRNGVVAPRRYATLEDIEATVRGPAGACGLSFRWGDAKVDGEKLTLTCIVSHSDGHSEASSVTLPLESRAGCSEAQKYGAVMTYAQRYSLIHAFGLTTCDDDTDAAPAEPERMVTPEQVQVIESLLDKRPAGSRARLLDYLKEKFGSTTLEELPASRFEWLRSDLERKIAEART